MGIKNKYTFEKRQKELAKKKKKEEKKRRKLEKKHQTESNPSAESDTTD